MVGEVFDPASDPMTSMEHLDAFVEYVSDDNTTVSGNYGGNPFTQTYTTTLMSREDLLSPANS